MNLNNYHKGIGVFIIVLLIVIYVGGRGDKGESMKKLLHENTDIELIRNTDKPAKGTTIIVNNDESIVSIELEKGLINIYKQFIPKPPKLPKKTRLTNTKVKVKTRFNNFNHYKKHLKNKRKRQRRKKNKHNKLKK